MICTHRYSQSVAITTATGVLYTGNSTSVSYPAEFSSAPTVTTRIWAAATSSVFGGGRPSAGDLSTTVITFQPYSAASTTQTVIFEYIAIGRWK